VANRPARSGNDGYDDLHSLDLFIIIKCLLNRIVKFFFPIKPDVKNQRFKEAQVLEVLEGWNTHVEGTTTVIDGHYLDCECSDQSASCVVYLHMRSVNGHRGHAASAGRCSCTISSSATV
jgi:hypothetical protein